MPDFLLRQPEVSYPHLDYIKLPNGIQAGNSLEDLEQGFQICKRTCQRPLRDPEQHWERNIAHLADMNSSPFLL